MPAPDAIIQYGDIPEATLVDEPNLLVSSLTFNPTRTKREYPGANGAIRGVQYRNPIMSIAFQATISTQAGIAIAGPGDEITELANFESTTHGFDPTVGVLILEDPSQELSTENANTLSGTIFHYPFVTN